MENDLIDPDRESLSSRGVTGCLLWFLGGISLSFMAIVSLVALVLLAASAALNVYLGWRLSGLEIIITQATPVAPQVIIVTATPGLVAAQPTEVAPPVAAFNETPTPSPTPPPNVAVEAQLGTVAAIATQQASDMGSAAAFSPPTATPPVSGAAPINPAGPGANPPAQTAPQPPSPPTAAPAEKSDSPAGNEAQAAAAVSANSYTLIPIKGERESRPAAEHGDLNLKLRDPQPIEANLELVEIDGSGIDPNTPKFNEIFEPDFSAAYTVHNWDWGCNCKGELITADSVVLVGVRTTPGEPVFIPPRQTDIFGGDYFATVLYADEDSLTFIYDNVGNVAKGYTVHYLGLETDPNLVALFRQSEGSELPGLTLDIPVGQATDELIVAIRDNGTFLDARSKRDWWQ